MDDSIRSAVETRLLGHPDVVAASLMSEESADGRRYPVAYVDRERELAIDPQFFLALARSDPRIGRADILVKRGKAHNELTRYRYDVVLHVGEFCATGCRRHRCPQPCSP